MMVKARIGVVGLAVASVALLATPASAAKTVFKATGKDINLVVTDCPVTAPAGTTCLSWAVFAAQQRVLTDGTLSKTAFLEVDKYRVRFTSTSFTFKLVQTYVSNSVTLDVEDGLASASGQGVVPTSSGPIGVSFALTANSPADSTRSRIVQKFDDCRILDRSSFASRLADGSATIKGKTYSSAVATGAGFLSTIDRTGQTTITKGQCPSTP